MENNKKEISMNRYHGKLLKLEEQRDWNDKLMKQLDDEAEKTRQLQKRINHLLENMASGESNKTRKRLENYKSEFRSNFKRRFQEYEKKREELNQERQLLHSLKDEYEQRCHDELEIFSEHSNNEKERERNGS